MTERTLKRAIQYMRAAKFVEIQKYPLEDLDPSAGPCVYKKGDLTGSRGPKLQGLVSESPENVSPRNMIHFPGNKVLVRCLRLLKPYSKKGVTEEDMDEDDEEDEDYTEASRPLPPEGRIMEHDMLSQAYHIGKQERSQQEQERQQEEASVVRVSLSRAPRLFSSVIVWVKGNSPVWHWI